jgi:DHA1 family bicyclomycin/chloramphenicol resistance-like MFS transporter
MLACQTALSALAIDTMLPAFDEMRDAFGLPSDSNRVALAVTTFFLGMALGQLFHGPLADRFGRKPVLYGSLLLYGICAGAATLAPTLEALIVVRFVWGAAAAGPHVVTTAVARDLYVGDEMARTLSFVRSVFLIVPVLAPALGELLIAVGSWRWVFGIGAVLAAIVGLWSVRLPETLDPEQRRPLRWSAVSGAFGEVVHSRVTLGYTAAATFALGAFLPWLGSSQLIFDEIYGRPDEFALWFALVACTMAVASLSAAAMVRRLTAVTMVRRSMVVFLLHSVLFVAVVFASDGVPPFGVFLLLIVVAVANLVAVNPSLISLAMERMGHIAGTASAVIGTLSYTGGALLAGIVDGAMTDSIGPLAIGFLVYGAAMLACMVWADGGFAPDG